MAMGMARAILALAAAASLAWSTPARAGDGRSDVDDPAYEQALQAAMHDLCDKQVALLGENGFHGDGQTVAFKSALIQRLVTHCGFREVYFEASHYDFLEIARQQRAGATIKSAQVSSAIGWVWNHDGEMQSLIGFLTRQVNAGRVTLGGLDDQLGGRDEFYSLERMPAEIVAYLPEPRRADCLTRLHQRIFYDYPQASPHVPSDLAPLQACIAEVRASVIPRPASRERDEALQLVANIERCLDRDFLKGDEYVRRRDASMASNFRWLAAQSPKHKVIVWAATVHLAKQGLKGEATLGSEIRQAYGPRAFVLGFSAGGGSYRYSRSKSLEIPPAPPASMEAVALNDAKGAAGYLGPATLTRLGVVQGAPFDHSYAARDWSKVIDALIVFRAERPPYRTDEPRTHG
jgi:erythromycin esterase-like protein